jgi:hypothetical protein
MTGLLKMSYAGAERWSAATGQPEWQRTCPQASGVAMSMVQFSEMKCPLKRLLSLQEINDQHKIPASLSAFT